MIALASRLEIPDMLNARGLLGTAVEVGVHVGSFAHHFRSKWKGRLYIGVDPWRVYPGSDINQKTHDEYFEHAKRALAPFGSEAALLHRTTGLDFAFQRAKGMALVNATAIEGLDFVYLDGDHSYESIRAEIEAFWPLVKSGGIIGGHDAIKDGWHIDNDPANAFATKKEAQEYAAAFGNDGAGVHEFGVLKAVEEKFKGDYFLTGDGGPDYGYRSWLAVKP